MHENIDGIYLLHVLPNFPDSLIFNGTPGKPEPKCPVHHKLY